jgi:hypothetical protein
MTRTVLSSDALGSLDEVIVFHSCHVSQHGNTVFLAFVWPYLVAGRAKKSLLVCVLECFDSVEV